MVKYKYYNKTEPAMDSSNQNEILITQEDQTFIQKPILQDKVEFDDEDDQLLPISKRETMLFDNEKSQVSDHLTDKEANNL